MCTDQNFTEADDLSLRKKRFSLHPSLINNKKMHENAQGSKQSKSGYLSTSNKKIITDGYISSSKENIPKVEKDLGRKKKDQ